MNNNRMISLAGQAMELIGRLLEKNAMNHVPTDEELKKMQESMGEVAEKLSIMEVEAAGQIRTCGEKQKNTYERSKAMIQEQAVLFESLDRLRAELSQTEGEYAKATAEAEERKRNLSFLESEMSNLEEQRRDALFKAEKRKQEIKKWCWVPFYNLYLVIDAEVQDFEGKINSSARKLNEKMTEYEWKCKKVKKIQEEYDSLSRQKEELNNKASKLQNDLSNLTEEIEQGKKELVYWKDMQIKLNGLKDTIAAGNASPDVLLEIMMMMEDIGEAG